MALNRRVSTTDQNFDHRLDAPQRQRGRDAMAAGGAHLVDRAGQRGRCPQQPAAARGEYLDVDPVAFVLARIVGPLVSYPVDRDQSPVEDDVEQPRRVVGGSVEGRCGGGEQVESLADVAVGGGHPDADDGGEAAVGVAVAKVRQDQQGLPAGVQAPPAGTRRGTGMTNPAPTGRRAPEAPRHGP